MSINGCMKKTECMPAMRYYSTLKKNEILSYDTWTNLEDIMLSEISQSQKDKYCMIPLT